MHLLLSATHNDSFSTSCQNSERPPYFLEQGQVIDLEIARDKSVDGPVARVWEWLDDWLSCSRGPNVLASGCPT